ncbi:MAG TPA: BON domain-containing protein [Thermoanaerobaculia bacterium]
MAYDNRDRDRGRGHNDREDREDRGDRGGARGRETRDSHGLFGYEGEGFMGGGDYDDFARRGYGRDSGYERGDDRGGTTGFNSGSYGTGSFYGTGGSGRGAYGGGGFSGGPFSGGPSSGGGDYDAGGGRGGADYDRSFPRYGPGGDDPRGFRNNTEGGNWRPDRDSGRGGADFDRGGIWGGGTTERQSFRGRGPKNYQRSDDRIREDVCELLERDHDVDASEIEVQVAGATVTLAGTVTDRRSKRRAEDLAESVNGVREVQNSLRVTRGEGQTY